jgi:hypothetical protein
VAIWAKKIVETVAELAIDINLLLSAFQVDDFTGI